MTPSPEATPRWRCTCGAFIIMAGTVSQFAFCARRDTCGKTWLTREEFAADPDVRHNLHRDSA